MSEQMEDDQIDPSLAPTEALNGPALSADGRAPLDLPDELSLLDGRFVIEKAIGDGAFGVVFVARDRKLNDKKVVVKMLRPDEHGDREWVERKFQDEVKALACINHPGVVSVLDRGTDTKGTPFVVMEYVNGVTLRSLLKAGPMPPERTLQLLRQIAEALEAAHRCNIVHRDLKPENILVQSSPGERDRVKVIDFGLASFQESNQSSSQTKVAGTFPYMGLEQFEGRPERRSDVYALAVIAYEMLAGKLPFPQKDLGPLLSAKMINRYEPLSGISTAVPSAVDEVICKATSVAVKDRPSTTIELVEALESAFSPKESPRSLKPGRRTVATGLGLLLLFTAVAAWRMRTHSEVTKVESSVSLDAAKPVATLTYWLEVLRYKDGKPLGQPFRLQPNLVLPEGYRVALHVKAEREGALYALNEGAIRKNGRPQYNVLLPSISANGGSSRFRSGAEVRVPEKGYFFLDKEEGQEKIWLVWSQQAIPQLEALQVKDRESQVIRNSATLDWISALLLQPGQHVFAVTEQAELRETTLATRDLLAIHTIKLEHY